MLIVPITTGTEIIDPFWPFRENDTQIVLVIEMGVCGSLALTEAIAPIFAIPESTWQVLRLRRTR
jgi:hypothetical protein